MRYWGNIKKKVTTSNQNRPLHFLKTEWVMDALQRIMETTRYRTLHGALENDSTGECATHSLCLFIGVQPHFHCQHKISEFSASYNTIKLVSCTSETAPGVLISSHSDIKNILHISCYYACKNDTKRSFLHRLMLTPTPLVILTLLWYKDFCPDNCNR